MDLFDKYEFSIQRVIYGWITLCIPLLIISQITRHQRISMGIQKVIRSAGVLIIGLTSLFLFKKSQAYYAIDVAPTVNDDECHTQLTLVTWQKNRHKLERDMYLAGCAIIASIALLLVNHWMNKYYNYMDSKLEQEQQSSKGKSKPSSKKKME